MAPTNPRGRPAGREPRPATKKDEPITAAESGIGGEKKPRGRGRPPKNGISKVVKIPSGRGRGRPRKDPSQVATTPKPKAPSSGRGRGRPPKDGSAATPNKSATPNAASATKSAPGSAKGRPGRKRKSEVVEELEGNSVGAAGQVGLPEDEAAEADDGEEADVEVGDALDDELIPGIHGSLDEDDDALGEYDDAPEDD